LIGNPIKKLNNMLEIVKHTFGLCGEHFHPNIFTFLTGGVGFMSIYPYIKHKYFNKNKK
jgi:hypothetical protein